MSMCICFITVRLWTHLCLPAASGSDLRHGPVYPRQIHGDRDLPRFPGLSLQHWGTQVKRQPHERQRQSPLKRDWVILTRPHRMQGNALALSQSSELIVQRLPYLAYLHHTENICKDLWSTSHHHFNQPRGKLLVTLCLSGTEKWLVPNMF